MDYSLFRKKSSTINTDDGFSLPVPPVTLGIGIVVLIMLMDGIALGCYMYQMGQTFNVVTGTVKSVTAKPLSGCRCLRDVFQDPQTAHKYMKYLDKKVQVDSSAPPEPEITPDRESTKDTRC